MAKRYSGDVELRLTCKKYKGWNGHWGLFYFARVSAPGHHGQGVLSLRECGVSDREDPRSPDAYDRAAEAFLRLADAKEGVGQFANKEGRGYEILRVQQAPCPVDMRGSPCPEKRSRRRRQ